MFRKMFWKTFPNVKKANFLPKIQLFHHSFESSPSLPPPCLLKLSPSLKPYIYSSPCHYFCVPPLYDFVCIIVNWFLSIHGKRSKILVTPPPSHPARTSVAEAFLTRTAFYPFKLGHVSEVRLSISRDINFPTRLFPPSSLTWLSIGITTSLPQESPTEEDTLRLFALGVVPLFKKERSR